MVRIVVVHLLFKEFYPSLGTLEAFVCPNDTNVIPHESPKFIPIVGEYNFFV